MKEKKLIGRLVRIVDKESIFHNHWGYIVNWDGEHFHVSGGSISNNDFNLTPIFDRDQFTLPRKLKNTGQIGEPASLWMDDFRK